ncbi:glutamyl-tRNA(Gln) amidotransferase [Apiospora rasikravindrae]|uniref:Glutamyl-tRNA(Gln) amidotransferase n=1 Tax=Apiospora rasikravindrae TaxID=990691 RepID=A0ABR1RS52_9PEZI
MATQSRIGRHGETASHGYRARNPLNLDESRTPPKCPPKNLNVPEKAERLGNTHPKGRHSAEKELSNCQDPGAVDAIASSSSRKATEIQDVADRKSTAIFTGLDLEPRPPTCPLASRVLDVMASYSQHLTADGGSQRGYWPGKPRFMDRVQHQMEIGAPIKMILPSFPWKSVSVAPISPPSYMMPPSLPHFYKLALGHPAYWLPDQVNTVDKVNGRLPDLGEVLALSRLNAMCEDVKKLYSPGALLHIATDGLVFDVGITDEDTWVYSEALMDIVAAKEFHAIKLVRVPDLQGLTDGTLDRATYLSLVSTSRLKLLEEYGRTEEEIRNMIRTDQDSLLTYRGFIRFLEKDLNPVGKVATSGSAFRKIVKKVASHMMLRAEVNRTLNPFGPSSVKLMPEQSFTKLLADKCSDHVRLSIHPSSGAVKLSIPLILTNDGTFPRTPWHCVIAVAVDGTYSTVHAQDVRETHVLVHQNGHPDYYRERSPLWDDGWDQEGVSFEPIYPHDLLITRRNPSTPSALSMAQVQKIRTLANQYVGRVRVSGFANTQDVFPEPVIDPTGIASLTFPVKPSVVVVPVEEDETVITSRGSNGSDSIIAPLDGLPGSPCTERVDTSKSSPQSEHGVPKPNIEGEDTYLGTLVKDDIASNHGNYLYPSPAIKESYFSLPTTPNQV